MTLAVAGVVALSLVAPGLVLLHRRRSRAAALLMLATAPVLLVAASADGWLGRLATVLAGLVLGPLAVLVHPRLHWRHPVDQLSVVALVGCGGVTLLQPEAVTTMVVCLLVVLGGHTWWSLSRAHGAERRAHTWKALAVATSVLVAGVVAFTLVPPDESTPWALLPFVVVGPALLVGASHPELTDTRALVADVVGHLSALVAVLAVFVGLAAPLLDLVPQSQALALLGLLAGALGAGYAPAQRVLRRAVAELAGVRSDPLAAVDLVTRSLGEEPDDALDAVRRALALPWAAVLTTRPLTSGTRPSRTVRVPLADDLPDLEVGLRDGDTRLARGDERLLALAAPLLGQSVRLHALAVQVRRSRADTVMALAEERRRLRRDLHDGLGPLLSGLAFTTDAATNLLRTDPDTAAALLLDVRRQADTALEDVRRLVYGMRPPALDELGLLGAVRQAVAGLPPEVQVTGAVDASLPAAVEVAAYRVAVGAVGNAARHAEARRVDVHVGLAGDVLRLQVDDDGPGRAPWVAGVGLEAMRERAVEVGGRLEAGPTSAGGRVVAELPVSPATGSSSTGG